MSENCDKCTHQLTDEQLEQLVEKVIQKMTERVYQEVGKKTISGLGVFLTLVGALTLSLYNILKMKGFIE